jgi:electron-transferring-flavoprotein dehydrogenase
MKNHGNCVASLSRARRWLAEEAEQAGAMILPETSATKLLVDHGRVVGVRTGDKGARATASRCRTSSRVGRRRARDRARRGDAGPPHRRGDRALRLQGENPQVWALGVKEVWSVAKPLRRVIHTLGWPLRGGAKYREFGGSFIYPMGDEHVTLGMVVGLDYRDVELSVHDVLQELKLHSLVMPIVAGGERLEWGAKTIPEGGLYSLPRKLHAPGLLLCGDGPGDGQRAGAQGHPLRGWSLGGSRLSPRSTHSGVGRTARDARRARVVRPRDSRQLHLARPRAGEQHAAGVRARLLARRRARRDDDRDARAASAGTFRTELDAEQDLIRTATRRYPAPDGSSRSTSSRRSSRREQDARRPAEPHPRADAVPRDVADCGRTCARARVRVGDATRRNGARAADPSNCVQCGAITAKGGRLTPPEGGSGPEYQRT